MVYSEYLVDDRYIMKKILIVLTVSNVIIIKLL